MRDVRVQELAGCQFNRIARTQLLELGLTQRAIAHQLATRGLVAVEQAVFALPPALEHDDWGRWMGVTLHRARNRAEPCELRGGPRVLVAAATPRDRDTA